MIWFWFIAAVFLTYRLAYLVVLEDGPLDVMIGLRSFAWHRFNENGAVNRGLNCFLCVSFWLSLIATWLLKPGNGREFILLWLGTAGAVLVLRQVMNLVNKEIVGTE